MSKLNMLWPYINDQPDTWKYSGCVIGGEKSEKKNTRFVKHWILNPDFLYKHLDPYYPKEK